MSRPEFSMLVFTIPFGGLLIMMGQHDRSEALFYYFRLEDQVPETHLLRQMVKYEGSENSSFFFPGWRSACS